VRGKVYSYAFYDVTAAAKPFPEIDGFILTLT